MPHTINLWVELTGKSIFWWEPVDEKNLIFKVCTHEDDKFLVRQVGSEIHSTEIEE